MRLLFLNELFTDQTVKAICWTLIHSLWEGLLIALIAGVVIVLTKKSSPALRYNILSGLFVLFLLVAGGTLIRELMISGSGSGGASAILPVIADASLQGNSAVLNAGPVSYKEQFVVYLNEHASIVVMVWLVILAVRYLRIFTNLFQLQRIRHYKTHAPSAYWSTRITELRESMRIDRCIRLIESEIVKVPLVIGFLKPAIIVPLGLLTSLPPDQAEAILLHELAHIKRKDYFVNILQTFAEVMFFFNPAILWISAQIREERENCCDDLAVARTNNPANYVRALVSFQEYALAQPQYATAFSGTKGHLLDRVKRIVFQNNKSLNAVEKVFLLTCLVFVTSLSYLFAKPVPSHLADKTPAVVKNDTIPQGKMFSKSKLENTMTKSTTHDKGIDKDTYTFVKKGNTYKLNKEGDQVTGLSINGKPVPADQMDDADNVLVVEKMMGVYNEKHGIGAKEPTPATFSKLDAMKNTEPQIGSKDRVIINDGLNNSKIISVYSSGIKMVMQDDKITQLSYKGDKVPEDKLGDYEVYARKLAEAAKRANSPASVASGGKPASEDPSLAGGIMKNIIAELVQEKIVTDEGNVSSVALTRTQLVVNGKPQPADVQQRYYDKYGKRLGTDIYYGDTHLVGTGIFLDKADLK